ncbi:MAG: hypothetical protein C5B53_13060 [Candidatus Melainabacteria bacterium]|nr:MAG: hypothetical protein C5B53_13060 [Candidatus Melainabacteria bacterium]
MSDAGHASGNNAHTDDDHGHDLYTVPPFVPEDSLQDQVLSLLAMLCCFSILGLFIYWSGLPLASVESEIKAEPAAASEQAK